MDTQIKLESGAMLNITMLPTREAMELLRIVSAEVRRIKIEADFNKELPEGADASAAIKSMLFDTGMINTMKDLLFQLLGSKELQDFLFETAFRRCLYNKSAINYDTFDEGTAREDFLPVCKEVLVYNLRPFLKSLRSAFFHTDAPHTSTPKLK